MNYCDTCLHKNVCGLEGAGDKAMTFCADKMGWIQISERPPQVGIDVLICDIEGDIFLTHRTTFGNYFAEIGCEIKNVKAWMPLPEPYKEEDKIISETSMHHFVCAFCDNDKCVRGTKECEFEQWKKKERKEE